MTVIAIAAAENQKIVTSNVTGVFFEANMPEGCEVIMSLDVTCAAILCKIDPRTYEFIREDGILYVILKKAFLRLCRIKQTMERQTVLCVDCQLFHCLFI